MTIKWSNFSLLFVKCTVFAAPLILKILLIVISPLKIRDYLCYTSQMIGEYASRTAYCEVMINGRHRQAECDLTAFLIETICWIWTHNKLLSWHLILTHLSGFCPFFYELIHFIANILTNQNLIFNLYSNIS